MESNVEYQQLLEEIRAKVELLHAAVEEISEVKKSLKITGSDVKAQIRDSISRHLETLRNRETWLLNQVEVVQHIKEDVLRQQLATLNQALGGLKNTCSLLEECTENHIAIDMENLKVQIDENVARIDELNLQADETSSITFNCNNFLMQEAIKQFGTVDSESRIEQNFLSLFKGLSVTPSTNASTSVEQKLCHTTARTKPWLLDKMGRVEVKNLSPTVSWPHANLTTQDWLQQSSRQKETRFSGKPLVKVPGMPLSSENWLARYQHEKARAGKDLIHKTVDPEKPLIKDNSPLPTVQTDSGIGQYYQMIKSSDSSIWLKAREDISAALKTDRIGSTYARIMASGVDEWLVKKNGGKMSRSTSIDRADSSCSSCNYCHISGDQTEITYSRSNSEISSEFSDWLAVKQQVIDQDEATRVMPVKDIEDAPLWLLSKKSTLDSHSKTQAVNNNRSGVGEFVKNTASTDIGDWLSHSLPKTAPCPKVVENEPLPQPTGGWLSNSSAPDPNNKGSVTYQSFYSNVITSYSSEWLQKPSDNSNTAQEKCEDKSGLKHQIEILSGDYNQWLIRESSPKADICKWLARTSLDKCKNCPKMCSKDLFKVFDEVSNTSEGWLLSSPN